MKDYAYQQQDQATRTFSGGVVETGIEIATEGIPAAICGSRQNVSQAIEISSYAISSISESTAEIASVSAEAGSAALECAAGAGSTILECIFGFIGECLGAICDGL